LVGLPVLDREVLEFYPSRVHQRELGPCRHEATLDEQIGLAFADVVAKAVFGILIGAIASER
jgi:hypothetical protein